MNRKTILVVDDAPENLDLLVGLLSRDFIVKAAVNGDIALHIARSEKSPDLILLDIVMPGKSGLDVCKILKNDTATAHIPIVFLSGSASSEDCDLGMDLGGAAYLKKPVNADSLFSILEILLPQ